MSSLSGHTAHTERPERSRNAKAQARHRAKRKAYIEQLEQTVTKLQTALGVSPDQVAALPPPLIKIRELEQENGRLHKENEELRRMISDTSGGRPLPLEVTRRTISHDSRNMDRDFKRRKADMDDQVYMDAPTHMNDLRPPPPLTIPHGSQYGNVSSHNSGSNSLYSINTPTFQMPNTPSGSSATSSPPFSPAQMHPSNSPVNPRPPLSSHQGLSNHSNGGGHYGAVKVEDENYAAHHASHTNNHYSNPLPSFYSQPDHGMDTWHSYSSERAPIHR
ncbi:hypothetical protein IW261DRAFT_1456806 [Armillaria novae-zelandiae]|uniref:BZIP domain-containing protein n=1 Tax=Armillaria novae-zelandiae TaxID=153914 RepID=A0AA39PHP7_9AGAR|nr:hypothetical protein IW261DRAFT_1456806 [Armillaria novae-zelandiae]